MKDVKEKIKEMKNSMTPRKVLTAALVTVVFLSVVGVSWSWFSALNTDGDVEGVTVTTANLSIQFTDTNTLNLTNAIPGQSASKTFTVKNNGNKTAKYSINWASITNNFTDKTDLVYKIESTDNSISYITVPNTGTHINIMNDISIASGVTHTYTITILFKNKNENQSDNEGNNMTGKLEVTEEAITDENASNTLANLLKANNTPASNPTTTPGRQISQTDEGLITGPNDDYGSPTYYFRGNVQDNYVSFAGKTWRVVRINGDGTVRMILNTTTGTNAAWNRETDTTYNSAYQTDTYSTMTKWLTYDNSPVKEQVESWYNTNIGNNSTYASKVATGKFCSDKSHTGSTKPIYFGPYNRLHTVSSASPQYTCTNSSDIYSLKVATISADEVAFAGGRRGTTNTSYYLYSGSWDWTMSSCYWYSSGLVNAFGVSGAGNLSDSTVGTSGGVRPVISLRADTTATLSSQTNPGTSSNPYIVQ